MSGMRYLLSVSAILAVAFVMRLGWATLVPVIPLSDSHDYHTFALSWVE